MDQQCLKCGKLRKVARWLENGPICHICYRKVFQEVCTDCGEMRGVAQRIEGRPICILCYKKRRKSICSDCGKLRPTENRLDEKPVCKVCARMRIPERYMKHYIYSAEERGYVFDLTLDQFTFLTSQPCFYCGRKLDTRRNGIDRKDNSLGYVYANCVPCCSTCNKLKGTLSIEEFIETVKMIVDHLNQSATTHHVLE